MSFSRETFFQEYALYWLEVVTQPSVKQSTYSLYFRMIQRHIIPAFGDISLENITETHIRDFINDKLTDGRLNGSGGLSEKTVRELLSLLNSILKAANSAGLIQANPLRNIKRPKLLNDEMRVFSHREQRRIERAVIDLGEDAYLGITLCLYTGLRVGELCALRWRNVNFERRTLTVAATLQRIQSTKPSHSKTEIIIDAPKSRRSFRTLPLTTCMTQKLRTYYASLPNCRKTPDDFVFNLPGPEGNRFIEPRLFGKYFHQVLRQARVKNANFHALRHTFATRCVELNMDIKSLSEVLGHSSVSITLNKYVHSFLEQKRKGMAKLDSIII